MKKNYLKIFKKLRRQTIVFAIVVLTVLILAVVDVINFENIIPEINNTQIAKAQYDFATYKGYQDNPGDPILNQEIKLLSEIKISSALQYKKNGKNYLITWGTTVAGTTTKIIIYKINYPAPGDFYTVVANFEPTYQGINININSCILDRANRLVVFSTSGETAVYNMDNIETTTNPIQEFKVSISNIIGGVITGNNILVFYNSTQAESYKFDVGSGKFIYADQANIITETIDPWGNPPSEYIVTEAAAPSGRNEAIYLLNEYRKRIDGGIDYARASVFRFDNDGIISFFKAIRMYTGPLKIIYGDMKLISDDVVAFFDIPNPFQENVEGKKLFYKFSTEQEIWPTGGGYNNIYPPKDLIQINSNTVAEIGFDGLPGETMRWDVNAMDISDVSGGFQNYPWPFLANIRPNNLLIYDVLRISDQRFIFFEFGIAVQAYNLADLSRPEKEWNETFVVAGGKTIYDNTDKEHVVLWSAYPRQDIFPNQNIKVTDLYSAGIPLYSPDHPEHNQNIVYLVNNTTNNTYTVKYDRVAPKKQLDVMLILDTSGSMVEGSKLADAKEAMNTFIDKLVDGRDRVGLITFSTIADLIAPLTYDLVGVQNLINNVSTPSGVTSLGAPIITANDEFIKSISTRPTAQRLVIMATDGLENTPPWAADYAGRTGDRRAVKTSIALSLPIFTIGIKGQASNYDEVYLDKSIAQPTGGEFADAYSGELTDVYLHILSILEQKIINTLPLMNTGSPPNYLNLSSIELVNFGRIYSWNGLSFTPDPASDGFEISFDPATRQISFNNIGDKCGAVCDGSIKITISIDKQWSKNVGGLVSNILRDDVALGQKQDYDETLAESKDIKAAGDIFIQGPNFREIGADVGVVKSNANLSDIKYPIINYIFRTGGELKWNSLRQQALNKFINLRAEAQANGRIFNFGNLADLNPDNKFQGEIWYNRSSRLYIGFAGYPPVMYSGKAVILKDGGQLYIDSDLVPADENSSLGFILRNASVTVGGVVRRIEAGFFIFSDPGTSPQASFFTSPCRRIVGGRFPTGCDNPNQKLVVKGFIIADEISLNARVLFSYFKPAILIVYNANLIKNPIVGFSRLIPPTTSEPAP